MGDAKEGRDEKKKEPDRLAEAIAKKVEELTVDGRDLHIRKWDLHTSLEQMSELGDVLKMALAGLGPSIDIGSLLQQDFGKLLLPHEDKVVKVLVGTLVHGNFNDSKEAEEWVRGLGLAEVLKIFYVIARQNIRPLVKTVEEVAREVGGRIRVVADAAQKGSQPQT